MIKVSNLVFDYPNHRALDTVSFEITKGSITALVGPNGSGKTTLLMCLSALVKPFSGTIAVNGIDVIEHPTSCKKMIGFLHDFFGLYENLSIRQVFTYFAHAHKVEKNKIDSLVLETTEKLNLSNKIDERVGNLSRGMKQRVAIGQSIIHKPLVLLLDEPASGLDPEARHSLSELFKELNNQGMTLIVSSHILAELNDYAKDIIVLKEGQIIEKKMEMVLKPKKQILISVLNSDNGLLKFLENSTNVESFNQKGNSIHLEFIGSEEEQSELLKNIIHQNYNISEFFVKQESIQDKYLNMVKG
ncbi:MAG: ABC transporter ATP-binding protein [Leptospiraceae bacterium]|nr:ABC transporter ATP-binding protein [Leptospiraceae bacterium]MCP5494123.1 ABC transporter ATP-binding protein [Leptospiraceae bacterium]